jgi:LemA protein
MYAGEIFWTAAILFGIGGIVGWGLALYNSLVALRNHIRRSWSNIDVLLKQRHDELPKLVRTCEGYMQHERHVFDKLSEARAALAEARTLGERAGAEQKIGMALGQLFAVAEAYPELKANQSFIQLQNRITDLENQIADRREFYNDTVTTHNIRIQQIPDKFLADFLSYRPAELFNVSEEDRQDVEIKFAA